jgi:hypothetical protein
LNKARGEGLIFPGFLNQLVLLAMSAIFAELLPELVEIRFSFFHKSIPAFHGFFRTKV